jgi:hypothetical protein
MTKAEPARAMQLRERGLTVAEIDEQPLESQSRYSIAVENWETRLKKVYTSAGQGLPIATTRGSFFTGLQNPVESCYTMRVVVLPNPPTERTNP